MALAQLRPTVRIAREGTFWSLVATVPVLIVVQLLMGLSVPSLRSSVLLVSAGVSILLTGVGGVVAELAIASAHRATSEAIPVSRSRTPWVRCVPRCGAVQG